jgi:hypothetical protein
MKFAAGWPALTVITHMSPERSPENLGNRLVHLLVTYLVALLFTLPLFTIVQPFVPAMHLGGVRLDHLLTFVLVLGAFIVLVDRLQRYVYVALIAGVVYLTASTLLGGYSVFDLYRGYAGLLGNLRDTAERVPLAAGQARPFHDAEKLRGLVERSVPDVRKEAVRMATAHFTTVSVAPNEHTLVQSFSIFKEVNSRWRYVSDVKGGEYFASPMESLDLMAGDCDDHAVLMAALIKSIGGEVRLVRTVGHVYPELRVGDDAKVERSAFLIRKVLFPKEVGDAPLFHHTDEDGVHWINLDYTRAYPGGELMNERIIGILEL